MAQNEFLSMYEFNVEEYDDICCIICKKIMVEPWAAECGCQFCGRCIVEYLQPENKCCPGSRAQCKDQVLIMNENIVKDFRAKVKIAKTNIKCPHVLCNMVLPVENMGDHLRLCELKPVPCPFFCVGCDDEPMTESRITEHYVSSNVSHVQLLLSAITGLRNDVQDLRKTLMEKDGEIQRQSEDCKRKETMIQELQVSIKELKVNVDILNTKDLTRESEFTAMIVELENVKIDIGKVYSVDTTCKQGAVQKTIQEIYDDRQFLWRINNFSLRQAGHIFRSCPLFKDSYKMYLCLHCNVDFVAWRCFVMRGEFDDLTMTWPMRHTVTMSILNQNTMLPYKQKSYSYDQSAEKGAFDKPTTEMNDQFVGDPRFMKVTDIMNQPGLLLDDCIILSFVVEKR